MTVKWVVFSPSRCSYMGWALVPGGGNGGWTRMPCCRTYQFHIRAEAEELAKAVGDGAVGVMAPPQPEPVGVDDPTYW
jgi:hypothetical protein